MEFHDREKELERLNKIVGFEPHTIHFIFGPINSGKTALIREFVRRLSDSYAAFYVNLRHVYISNADDFLKVLFDVRGRSVKECVKSALEMLPEEILTPKGRIPVPKNALRRMLKEPENVFVYLENFLNGVAEKKRPVLILDELQVIRDIEIDGKLIYRLFNFFVGLTKESHLCHVFCLTSDSLFVEQVYGEAVLQGRAKYVLVDDFDYETTKSFLEKHGFDDDEIKLVWKYFGGKPSYLIQAVESRDNLKEFCDEMLEMRFSQILDTVYGFEDDEELFENVLSLMKTVVENETVTYRKITPEIKACVDANILFVNPVKRVLKPQSRLDLLAMERVIGEF